MKSRFLSIASIICSNFALNTVVAASNYASNRKLPQNDERVGAIGDESNVEQQVDISHKVNLFYNFEDWDIEKVSVEYY